MSSAKSPHEIFRARHWLAVHLELRIYFDRVVPTDAKCWFLLTRLLWLTYCHHWCTTVAELNWYPDSLGNALIVGCGEILLDCNRYRYNRQLDLQFHILQASQFVLL